MKIAVMGAGAVGCYFGGMLARGGHDVTLIARAAHVEAIRRDGLLMETRIFREYVPLQATTDAAAVRGARLLLFCVKSTDTESAAAQIAGALDADATVLSLQNGVDNAERAQAALGRPVAAAVVYVATEMAGPGHVKHHGRGDLVMAPVPGADALVEMFGAAGVPVQVSDNVAGALWAKLVVNCAYNAISAIVQQPYGRLSQGAGVEAVMRDLMDESLAVARAAGVTLPGDSWQAIEGIARTMPMQFSSTAQDLARGRRSEIDHLNGFIAAKGAALGVATPVNRALHALVRLLEAGPAPTAATSPPPAGSA